MDVFFSASGEKEKKILFCCINNWLHKLPQYDSRDSQVLKKKIKQGLKRNKQNNWRDHTIAKYCAINTVSLRDLQDQKW